MRKADWFIILLVAAVAFLIIFYLVRAYDTLKQQNPDRPSVEETLRNTAAADETATLEEEDEYDEEEYNPDGIDTTAYEEEASIDQLADLNAKAGSEDASDASPTDYSTTDERRKFLVVAGTFKQAANATTQLKEFKKMGYDDAEIGKFNKSTYASLIVDRFATAAEAKRLVRALKEKGIDAYVHKKR